MVKRTSLVVIGAVITGLACLAGANAKERKGKSKDALNIKHWCDSAWKNARKEQEKQQRLQKEEEERRSQMDVKVYNLVEEKVTVSQKETEELVSKIQEQVPEQSEKPIIETVEVLEEAEEEEGEETDAAEEGEETDAAEDSLPGNLTETQETVAEEESEAEEEEEEEEEENLPEAEGVEDQGQEEPQVAFIAFNQTEINRYSKMTPDQVGRDIYKNKGETPYRVFLMWYGALLSIGFWVKLGAIGILCCYCAAHVSLILGMNMAWTVLGSLPYIASISKITTLGGVSLLGVAASAGVVGASRLISSYILQGTVLASLFGLVLVRGTEQGLSWFNPLALAEWSYPTPTTVGLLVILGVSCMENEKGVFSFLFTEIFPDTLKKVLPMAVSASMAVFMILGMCIYGYGECPVWSMEAMKALLVCMSFFVAARLHKSTEVSPLSKKKLAIVGKQFIDVVPGYLAAWGLYVLYAYNLASVCTVEVPLLLTILSVIVAGQIVKQFVPLISRKTGVQEKKLHAIIRYITYAAFIAVIVAVMLLVFNSDLCALLGFSEAVKSDADQEIKTESAGIVERTVSFFKNGFNSLFGKASEAEVQPAETPNVADPTVTETPAPQVNPEAVEDIKMDIPAEGGDAIISE
ncbi:hypothetical protein NECID01_0394 [Nematocida sp. AWRm77]|nr:hypothetical protein NECID01_0394 [Nematocida sp. AWRm77]